MNIIESSGNYQIYNSINLLNKLPLGVYAFDSGLRGPYLTRIKEDSIKIPPKVYSNDKLFLEHVVRTWKNSNESLGILLTGKKGLGKSFTANLLCALLPELPVIKITREIGKGEGLIEFLNEIEQEHIVYIDEFEKIFTEKDASDDGRLNQKVFLSFLDGGNTVDVKRLFIITTNDSVNDYFINRPTRLRYVREYDGLDIDVIREVVNDRLNNKEFLPDLLEYIDQDSVNIDILVKVIDEINLHNIPYSKFREFFNYKSQEQIFDTFISVPGIEHPIQLDPLMNYGLNQIKNRTYGSWDFGEATINNKECNVYWRGKSLIKKMQENHYELECEYVVYDEENEVEQKFPVMVRISKQIRYLAF